MAFRHHIRHPVTDEVIAKGESKEVVEVIERLMKEELARLRAQRSMKGILERVRLGDPWP